MKEYFDINQIQDPDKELVKTWVGSKKQNIYLKKYYNKELGFNLSAFLIPDLIFFTRKMWVEAFLIIAFDFLCLLLNGGIPYPVALIIRVILGFIYYPLYSASIRRKIKKYKEQGLSYEEQLEKAKILGGDKVTVSVLVTIILAVIIGIFLVIRFVQINYSKAKEYSDEKTSEIIKKIDDEATHGTHLDSLVDYIGEAINVENFGKSTDYVSKIEKKNNIKLGWRLFYQGTNKTFLIMDKISGKQVKPSDYYDKMNETRYTDGSKVGEIGKKLNPMLFEQKPEFFTSNNTSENIKYLAWMTDTQSELWDKFKDNEGIVEYAIGGVPIELYTESFNRTASIRSDNYTLKIGIGTYGYRSNYNFYRLSSSDNNGIYYCDKLVWLASPGSVEVRSGGDLMGSCISENNQSLANYHVQAGEAYLRPLVCIQTDTFNEKFNLLEE